MKKNDQNFCWTEVDLEAISYNFRGILSYARRIARSQRSKKMHTLAVVKADAYGHGMIKVAKLLTRLGADYLGVSDIQEGIQLRQNGIKQPILLFESTLHSLAKNIIDYQLTPTVCTLELARALNKQAVRQKKKIDVHVKVDTGMGRLGVWHTQAVGFIHQLMKLKAIRIQGVYTHLACADTDSAFTAGQIKKLTQIVSHLDKQGIIIALVHAANSMGMVGYRSSSLNLVRPGLMLYGFYPHTGSKKKIRLKPALTVKAKVIFIKDVEKGRSISYGRTFIAPRRMKVATLSIGYNDGYPRILSNKAYVVVKNKRCAVIGRVTMDQIMIDVTQIKSLKLGNSAIVLGESVPADELAKRARSINYEVVCSFGNRLPRKYKT